ncbi:MAG TPA: hypothetical protein VEC36_05185 [Patescibacteria group bacterium]|nr:hypothetical protein [Patescibacteria group bacterium]
MRYFLVGFTSAEGVHGSTLMEFESLPKEHEIEQNIRKHLQQKDVTSLVQMTSLFEFKDESEYKNWRAN